MESFRREPKLPGGLSRRQLLASLPLVALGPTLASIVGCKTGDTPVMNRPTESDRTKQIREVAQRVDAESTSDGAGVKLRRALGNRALSMLDPFLMLDAFGTDRPEDYIAGFPSHPHRGFETVTYMLDGAMEHQDSLGNKGHLSPGSIQWMTAGRGIIHSEMPKQESGRMAGFQLWVNLPAASKMTAPRYQDLSPDRVVDVDHMDAHVRLIAGQLGDKRGPVEGIVTAPTMLDVRLQAKGTFDHPIPAGHNAFAYVFEGAVSFGTKETLVNQGQLAVLVGGDVIRAKSASSGRFLLLAGKPLNEPVARYGPFVMNTDAEIRRAIEDYRSGRLVTTG